jgi:AcrR family transcriptional regulator
MKRSDPIAERHTLPPPRERGIATDAGSIFTRGDASRRALLLAGAEVFGEKGLEGATTREIAAKAGQNIAAISYYFEGKEGLYLAIAQEIGTEMSIRLQPVVAQVEAAKPLTPDLAQALLRRLVSLMVHAVLSNRSPIAQFILREQQQPTAAFDILYTSGMGRVHEALNRLFACVLGRSPADKQAIVRSHALFGQIVVFRAAHALILRRAGWTELGEAEIGLIEKGVLANLDSLCNPGPQAAAKGHKRASKPASRRPALARGAKGAAPASRKSKESK